MIWIWGIEKIWEKETGIAKTKEGESQ